MRTQDEDTIEERHSEWFDQETSRLYQVLGEIVGEIAGRDDVTIRNQDFGLNGNGTHDVQLFLDIDGQRFDEYELEENDE